MKNHRIAVFHSASMDWLAIRFSSIASMKAPAETTVACWRDSLQNRRYRMMANLTFATGRGKWGI
jgi:hypothetical protein